MTLDKAWFSHRIVNPDPLITFSSTELDTIGIAILLKENPGISEAGGMHFLSPVWTLENGAVEVLLQAIAKAQADLPRHVFVCLASTVFELYLLGKSGLPAILANGSIFVDETTWRVQPANWPGLDRFDAVYNARLLPYKRHELASALKSLMLISHYAFGEEQEKALADVQKLLPHAFFANRKLASIDKPVLSAEQTSLLLAHAGVGLVLSSEEGATKASIEYMLCGLPVVSTNSLGGRDRYYGAPYCQIVPDDPDAAAAAVKRLVEARLERLRIREHVSKAIAFDRHNFLLAANRMIKHHMGLANALPSFRPLLGLKQSFVSLGDNREEFGLQLSSM